MVREIWVLKKKEVENYRPFPTTDFTACDPKLLIFLVENYKIFGWKNKKDPTLEAQKAVKIRFFENAWNFWIFWLLFLYEWTLLIILDEFAKT